jgi:hypothetical protein
MVTVLPKPGKRVIESEGGKEKDERQKGRGSKQ